MEVWQSAPPFVLLVELPALSDLDAVLEAEQMPLVIWVTASGELQQQELAQTMEMVEAAEINLAATVLNREPELFSKLPFLDKFGLVLVLVSALALCRVDAATVTNAPPPADALSFSSQVPRLASWQQRLVIGPGDSFNFYIYGKAGTIRNDVTVAPDGRLSYLEAQSVPVAGLTVDEMRTRLDAVLTRYYHDPHTVAMPVAWRSKRYCILGAVMDKGIYILDRPLTIIEAVARARGIATGLYEHNTVELADMPRAFLIRQGRRAPVDFDRLFNKGDLSQNILIEPGDYLYFPSGTVNEVYLLGAVGSPGPLGLTAETTMIGVLTVRGGFRPTAYRQRVLVVRGSLEHPQTFPVNVAAILAGKEKDFQLLPGDIIYVADKPWQRAEELLQMALGSFVQTMTATWAGNNIGPFITQPLLPHL
jgi:protein involved in polysaccharide export with SLBB domain